MSALKSTAPKSYDQWREFTEGKRAPRNCPISRPVAWTAIAVVLAALITVAGATLAIAVAASAHAVVGILEFSEIKSR